MRFSPPLRRWLVTALALLATAAGAASPAPTSSSPREAADASDGQEERLLARLWVEPLSQESWRVGVELVPDPGWHVYWRNPGDTGLAPKLAWELDGASFGEIAWPSPEAFYDPEVDLVSYGYGDPVLLATTARIREDAERLEVSVDALVCAHQCIPGTFRLGVPLERSGPMPGASKRFADAAGRVPRPARDRGVEVVVEAVSQHAEGSRATLAVFPCGSDATTACDVGSAAASGPGFFPLFAPDASWRATAPQPHPEHPQAFQIELEESRLGDAPAEELVIAGVVPLRDVAGRDRSVEVSLAAAPGGSAIASGAGAARWLQAALLGWIGGLLLNLMPCVLPVLAIKLASLASLAQGPRHEHRKHAAAYTAGIGISMLALASVVLALRAAGTAVGWGFQLQEPAFLVGISALLVAFALNLFGAFEIDVDTSSLGSVGADAPGAGRSFFDGLLAVALATPCSAPFLGTAVGFAFASPAAVIVTIFLAIGLGLATPFLLAAAFPGWTRVVPRSGGWMADLRGALGFALLLTVVWLLWVLGRAVGSGAMSAALVLLLAVAAGAWTLGLVQRRRRLPATVVALVLGGITVAGIGVVDFTPVAESAPATPVIATARPFTAGEVEKSLRQGRPVFVYFTADWCVTCKVNERGVLADPRIGIELEERGVDVYLADWTRRDEKIRAALAGLGKAGVPVYALYDPTDPERPRLLPELLTVDGLLGAVRDVAPVKRNRT